MTATSLTAPAPSTARPGAMARLLMLPVRAWRRVSVHLPPRCRFYPSCSQYALDALATHGALRGTWLAVRRVGRCHPWHDGGLDPVPPPRTHHTNTRSQQQPLRSTTATTRSPGRAEET
jgi:putative membrane protein insertion efficiency factor